MVYVDGQAQDIPFAQLPTAGADGRPWARARFEILDADLPEGLVAASIRFTLAEEAGRAAACPAIGRTDPREGLILALIRAGYRDPVAQWLVYDVTLEGQPCTDEAAAAATLQQANAAFAERGLDPNRRPALIAPSGDADPFAAPGVQLVVDGHTWSIGPSEGGEMPLEAQLTAPDLVAGSWASENGQTAQVATIRVDDQPVDELRVRWPEGCAGGSAVAGALADGPHVAIVYRTAVCAGGGPAVDDRPADARRRGRMIPR